MYVLKKGERMYVFKGERMYVFKGERMYVFKKGERVYSRCAN